MLAEIITIGDEILIGQIVDTNSAWMAGKLNEAGIRVKQVTSVSDDREHILTALKDSGERAELVLLTGGLGPTKDDITKKTLAEYFNTGFRQDEETLGTISGIFAKYNRPLLEANIRQADVLENCITLQNKVGTAPGMWIEEKGIIYVSLPGVPFEMMYLMEEEVLPRLSARPDRQQIVHKTLLTSGIGESFLADLLEAVEDSFPEHIKLAYLPKLGQVRLRLSGYGDDRRILEKEVNSLAGQIKEKVGEFLVTDEDKPIEKVIIDLLDSRRQTLSVAESCTGGYISHQITQHPGCSSVFLGGAISYSYELKQSMLGVEKQLLEFFGAVSRETVTQMVEGAMRSYGSDYAVAVSGIAGPGGGTPEKPVGMVWIAVASRDEIVAKKFQFGSRRAQNIERAAAAAFTLLFQLISKDQKKLPELF